MPRLFCVDRFSAKSLCVGIGVVIAAQVGAQTDPRLTGAAVVQQVEQAKRALADRKSTVAEDSLKQTMDSLDTLAQALREALANEPDKPLNRIDDEQQAQALNAVAAAQRTQAYLASTNGCIAGQVEAAAQALVTTVAAIAESADSPEPEQPVIDSVESLDNRSVFALYSGTKHPMLALVGSNLTDARCENLPLSATDGDGKLLAAQPEVAAVSPNRIEISLPDNLEPGGYFLHVVPQRKKRLFGCSAKPEATAVVWVMPPLEVSVDYSLTGTCRDAGGAKTSTPPAANGTLPALTAPGTTVSQAIDSPVCDDPLQYALAATARFSDDSTVSIGPISQGATAGITAGAPGGLSLRWDPAVQTVFATLAPNACRAVY